MTAVAIALALAALAAALYAGRTRRAAAAAQRERSRYEALAGNLPDVTATMDLQRELESSRGFLAGVLEQLTDHVAACDADGRLQLVNEARYGRPDPGMSPLDWSRYFGLRTADGRTPLAPDEVPLFRALHGEVVADAHVAVEPPGHAVRHVMASARPVHDDAGRLIGAVAWGVDVTERRETEARLRASEERYRSVVENVDDIVFQTDLRGRWSFVNESWSRWSGIAIADGLGRPAHELVHPDDRAAHARAFAPLVAGETDSVHLRHRYLTADGVTRWAEVRASLARDASGRPFGIVGVIEDVSERHRTKQYEAAEQAVVDVLGEAPDVEQGVPGMLEVLCRHLDWDLAELWTFDPGTELVRCTDVWGQRRAGLEAFERGREGLAFEIGDGLPGQAWARRAPIWASGLAEDPLFRRGAEAAAAGVQSALAMPIMRGGEVHATILFFAREQREPDPALARLLQTIGAHLAQFLQRRHAERALAERSAEVDALSRLVSELRAA